MPVPLPEPRGYPGNLGCLFADHVKSARTAIVDLRDAAQPREISYSALDALCNAVARGLRRRGLQPGDRIAILSLNRHEFVATVLGAMRAGVVPVPINIKITGSYHDMGSFASDVAQLPRIVTLNDVVIGNEKGILSMEAVAKTFRYLDEDEVAKQRALAKQAKEKGKK